MIKTFSQASAIPLGVFLSAIFPYVGPLGIGTQPVFPLMLLLFALSRMTSNVVLGVLMGCIFAVSQVFWLTWEGHPVMTSYVAMVILIGVFAFLYPHLSKRILEEKKSMIAAVHIARVVIIVLLFLGVASSETMLLVNELVITEVKGTHLNSIWFFAPEPGHGAFAILSFFILSYIANGRRAVIFDTVLSVVCLALIKTLTSSVLLVFLLYLVFLKRESLMAGFGGLAKVLTVIALLGTVGGGVLVATSSGIANARIQQLQNYEEEEGSSPAIRILQLKQTVETVINFDFYKHVGDAPAVGIYSYLDRFPLVTALFIVIIFSGFSYRLKVIGLAYVIMLPVLSPFLFIFVVYSKFYGMKSGTGSHSKVVRALREPEHQLQGPV